MKYLVFILIGLLALWGCSPKESSSSTWFEDNGKVKVLSTTAMIDDLVGEIGGDLVDHTALIVGEIDPHSYELVKGDDEKIAFADLMIGNGLNLEHGASLCYQMQNHKHIVYLGEEIQKRVPHKILFREGEVDPHVWMDVSLWAEGVDAIVEALIKEDPENAHIYTKNGDQLRQEMLLAHRSILNELGSVPDDDRYLVTSHDAFHYFTEAYLGDGERCMAPEGLAPEGQLSSSDIQRVVDHLCARKIQVVFPESNVSADALKKIVCCCSSKGQRVRISKSSLYSDAMGGVGSGADTYIGMMQHNAHVLKQEWQN